MARASILPSSFSRNGKFVLSQDDRRKRCAVKTCVAMEVRKMAWITIHDKQVVRFSILVTVTLQVPQDSMATLCLSP